MSTKVLDAMGETGFLLEVSDAWLVARAKRGDREAFDQLMKRHEQKVFFTAMRITRNREDAEDVVQQSFHNAFIHLPEFQGKSSFSTWLTRIALNEAFMHKRRARRSRLVCLDDASSQEGAKQMLEVVDSGPGPELTFSTNERSQLVLLAVEGLKPEMRSAIKLFHFAETSIKETADMLGVSVTAVKSRVNRGRSVLREKLKLHFLPVSAVFPPKRKARSGRPVRFAGAVAR